MCVVLVVDNILEIDARGVSQIVEELLREYERDAALLLDLDLGGRVVVGEVGGDADGEFFAKLLAIEAGQRVASAVGAYYAVERGARERMVGRRKFDAPRRVLVHARLDHLFERGVKVNLDAHE